MKQICDSKFDSDLLPKSCSGSPSEFPASLSEASLHKIQAKGESLDDRMTSLLVGARKRSGLSIKEIARRAEIDSADVLKIEKSPSQVPCYLLHALVIVYGGEFSFGFNDLVREALMQQIALRQAQSELKSKPRLILASKTENL